jgi:hypothetical protein
VQDLPAFLADFSKADASSTGGRRTMLLGIDQAEEMTMLATLKETEELRRLFAGLGVPSLARRGKGRPDAQGVRQG